MTLGSFLCLFGGFYCREKGAWSKSTLKAQNLRSPSSLEVLGSLQHVP